MLHKFSSNITQFPRIHFAAGQKAIPSGAVKYSRDEFGAVLVSAGPFSPLAGKLACSAVW